MMIVSLFRKLLGVGVLCVVVNVGLESGADVTKSALDMTRIVACQAELRGLDTVLNSLYIRDERYPANPAELGAWLKEHYSADYESARLDPWDKFYVFCGPKWLVLSAGPDKQLDTLVHFVN